MRFDLWKPSLEKRLGIRFETGKMYLVRGMIPGVGSFESRHIARANPHVYVFPRSRGAARIRAGAKYSLEIEGIEERRKLDVAAGDRGSYLSISKPALEGLGIRCEREIIVELTLRNCRDGVVRRAFAKYRPAMEAVQAFVSAAGYQVGDSIELVEGKEYSIPRFAEDFGRCREGPTGNVDLEIVGEDVGMRVAGHRVEVARSWLDTRGLSAVLNLEVQPDARRIKFEFDGRRITPRLEDSSLIREFKATSGGLELTYARTTSLWYSTKLGVPRVEEWEGVLGWLIGKVRAISGPGEIGGAYALEVEQSACEEVRKRLNATRSPNDYKTQRGNIGEDIFSDTAVFVSIRVLERHPFAQKKEREQSRRTGPDLIVRLLNSGKLSLVEVKWWDDINQARKRARVQVRKHFLLHRSYKREEIEGAYIALLDWKPTSTTGRMILERVV